MDINTLWIIALSIATPVAGVVGFAAQLRQVKKAHLENEKLQLEIIALRKQVTDNDQMIQRVSTEDVLKFAGQESRRSRKHAFEARARPGQFGDLECERTDYKRPLRERLTDFLFGFVLLVVVLYFIVELSGLRGLSRRSART